MKIAGIKIYKFSVRTQQDPERDPRTGAILSSVAKPWLFLKIETDAGIGGWGEGSSEWITEAVDATLRSWSSLLVGRDPLCFAALTDDIADRIPWKGGPVFNVALAAINMALHDIAGKAWGVPVHTILGGKRRHQLRVYANGGTFTTPEASIAVARQKLGLGYAGVKGNPLESRTWPMDAQAIEHSIECVAALREALGPHVEILLDTHGSPSPELSIEFARQVARYRPLFLEEPVKVGSIEALLAVSRASPVPIATGEKLTSLRDHKQLTDVRACAFLQPDIMQCAGITNTLQVAKLAAHSQMLLAPHGSGGPLCHAATFQVDASIDNFLIQEVTDGFFSQFDRYVEHDWRIKDGYVNVTERPGIGVEVKEADISRLPYDPLPFREYRYADGSWKGW